MSQLFVKIYKLSHTALRIKAGVVKVKHYLLHVVFQVNKSNALWLKVAQCTVVKVIPHICIAHPYCA